MYRGEVTDYDHDAKLSVGLSLAFAQDSYRAAEQATHRTTPPTSATTGLALPQGACPSTKLLASVACGSLSSERGFPCLRTRAARAYY